MIRRVPKLFLILTGIGMAWCSPALASRDDPWAQIAALPVTVDAAAVLDRPGSRLWSDPAGIAVRRALSSTGLFTQTERAWAGLADALGYSQDQAAAALLGRRVLIAWDGLSRGDGAGTAGRADTRWAVLAEVDRDTAREIRTRLRAAPRRTVQGRVVYSVDAGRTAMAVIEEGAETRVVFAPNGATALLESLLLPPTTPADSTAPGAPESMGDAARRVLGRVDPGWAGVAAFRLPGSDRPATLELRAAGEVWGLRVIAPTEAEDLGAGTPIGVLNEIGEDALFAAAFQGGPRFDGAVLDLGLRLGTDARNEKPAGPIRHERGTVMVLRAPGPTGGAGGGLVAQMVSHASTDAAFSETIDRTMSAMIGGTQPPEHRGQFPDAVRTHAIAESTPTGAWPGPDSRVAWCMATDPERQNAGVVSMSIAPAGIDPAIAARQGREAWLRGAHDHDPTMFTAGRARPRALADAFDAPETGATFALARAVEQVDWTVRLVGQTTRFEVFIRFAPPGSQLGGP